MSLLGPTIDPQTAELCRVNPLAQQLRGLFYRLDRAAERNGWAEQGGPVPETSQPTLYAIEADRARRHLSHTRNDFYTAALHHLAVQTGGHVGKALLALAHGTETTRDIVTEIGVVSSVEDAIRSDLGDNWDFYGMVFSSEAWTAAVEVGSAEMAAVRAHQLHTLPGRVEVRVFSAFTRDGYHWYYERIRGDTEATLFARKAGDLGPIITGGVANALARMVNAIIAQQDRQPVPVCDDNGTDSGRVAPNTARRES